MKKMLLLYLVLLFCSCEKNNKSEAFSALKLAGKSMEVVKELPLGFRFGMNENELDSQGDELIGEKLFGKFVDGCGYPYLFVTGYGTLDTYVYFRSVNNGMYQMVYEFYGLDVITRKQIFYDSKKSILQSIKNKYKDYAHYRYEDKDIAFGETTDIFVKDNLTIMFTDSGGGKLSLYYTNRPVYDKIEKPVKKESTDSPSTKKENRPILNGENERYVKDISYAAISREKLNEMHINLDSKDFINQMLTNGEILILNKNDKVIVLDFSTSGNKVRVLSGAFSGHTVYISNSLLDK